MPTALISDPRFLEHRTGLDPETPRRLEVIRTALEADGALWARLAPAAPGAAAIEDLERCHSLHMIEDLREAVSSGVRMLDADTAVSSESFEVARLAAGAALRGVDLVLGGEAGNAFAAIRPPGHHARPETAMGFCLFNNAAVAARYAQVRYGVEFVLIVDWDVHHGNGTQEIFYRDPSVFYFSTHQYPYYPGTGGRGETGAGPGAGTTLNVPLGAGTSALLHGQAFADALEDIERRFRPDLVIVSAGFDARRGDPLGGLRLEDADFEELTRRVRDLAERHAGGRLVSLLEGGYNLETLGRTVLGHVRALAEGA